MSGWGSVATRARRGTTWIESSRSTFPIEGSSSKPGSSTDSRAATRITSSASRVGAESWSSRASGTIERASRCGRARRSLIALWYLGGYSSATIALNYGAEFSFVEGAYSGAAVRDRLGLIRKFHEPQKIEVPARTLSSILEEVGTSEIDFFSLDVEGYELSVLQGLDFATHAPKVMLIECQTEAARDDVEVYLADRYRLQSQLSSHDYLFVKLSRPPRP